MRIALAVAIVAIIAFASLSLPASATPLSHTRTLTAVDWTSAGVAGVGDTGAASITISGVNGPVTDAFLYWHIVSPVEPPANPSVTINGNSVVGVTIADASSNCWESEGFTTSRSYRADVG